MFLSCESPALVESSPRLAQGHVHEVHGDGRRPFAAREAATMSGTVLWIAQGYGDADGRRLNPNGLAGFFDPARVILILCPGAKACLQAGEDALRSNAVPLVVLDLMKRPELTPGRRLNLAAEAGRSTGLILLPDAPSGTMTAWTVRRVACCAQSPGWRETLIRDRAHGFRAPRKKTTRGNAFEIEAADGVEAREMDFTR